VVTSGYLRFYGSLISVYAADDDCTKLDGAGARQLAAVLIEAADEIGPARGSRKAAIKYQAARRLIVAGRALW
jgi:hypothetical protein